MPTNRSPLANYLVLATILAFVLAPLPSHARSESASEPNGTIDNAASNAAINAANAANQNKMLAIGDTGSASDPLATFGPPSGTVVSQRAAELRDEVVRLRTSVNLNANQFALLRSSGVSGTVQYHATVAAITARLQNGTTRGNPILMRQWDEANNSLSEVTSYLSRLNALLIAIDTDTSVAAYLAQSVRAGFELAGALDEDHDQLKLLLDEINRQVVQLDYLRSQTMSDIRRQNNYLTTERSNLQALAFAIGRGEMIDPGTKPGAPMPVTSYAPPQPMSDTPPQVHAAPTMPVTPSSVAGVSPQSFQKYMAETASQQNGTQSGDGVSSVGRLVVLIRYNQPVVDYQAQLSQAIGSALEHHPDAEFAVVAVSPSLGDPSELARTEEAAKRNADDVKHSLVQLGLSPSKITVGNTQMQSAQVPEVHIYIR